MKKFKAESKKVLDLMINSIYTNKEIFLRELLSNASDAIDKLYYKSLQLGNTGLTRSDFAIMISVDNDKRTLTISDNGIGMSKEDLDNNLGVIARSGSSEFKKTNDLKEEDINIIGQFGVGFYSAFMVADKVEVISKAHGSEEAFKWVSDGAEGYDITPCEKASNGTDIVLYLKKDDDNEKYSKFLEEYTLKNIVTKYSNYISYPIKMLCTNYNYDVEEGKEPEKTQNIETLNSMIPLWKKNKSEVKDEEYNEFYKEMFYDTENPCSTIRMSVEGAVDFKALLFIPSTAPYNYYSREYEKGLRLYTDGVMITEKCKDLIPDYFGFVRGIVDTDIQLNVSRETVQQSRSLKVIATSVEKKIKTELENMLANDREKYEKFYKAFGLQLKFGIYQSFGMNKETLQDLIMFYSVKQDKMITLKEYVNSMVDDQKFIYYATGKTIDSIKLLPQLDKVLEKGYDILCMTDDVDEFTAKTIGKYSDKEFKSVSSGDLGIDEEETPEDLVPVCDYIKEQLKDKVEKVRISTRIKNHQVCFTTEGDISLEMEKVFSSNPSANAQMIKAKKVLEINSESKITEKIKTLFNEEDKSQLNNLIDVIYGLAEIIEGMQVENPTSLADKVCDIISK